MPSTPVVTISYADLVSFSGSEQSVLNKIAMAFGASVDQVTTTTSNNGQEQHDSTPSLGILAVTQVPNLLERRQRLLPMARQLALLENKDDIICEASKYQTGWSHGKEIFDGKPDFSKGSFYANPLMITPDDLKALTNNVPIDIQRDNPGFFAPNVWPTHESMADFQPAFLDLASLVMDVGRLVARPCDVLVSQQCPGYHPRDKLTQLLKTSSFCKARLLHYFAISKCEEESATSIDDNEKENKEKNENCSDPWSDWCGWHNDHGSLTGLIPAMYLDTDGNEIQLEESNDSGLYIQARDGSIHHVCLPHDSIGFQIGETSQIHSGGILQATPHAVRQGAAYPGMSQVTRESFAVFMEPEYLSDMDLPEGTTVDDVQDASIVLPSSVKTLSSRWKLGMNFGEFSNATFRAFYDTEDRP